MNVLQATVEGVEKRINDFSISISGRNNLKKVLSRHNIEFDNIETVDGEKITYQEIGAIYEEGDEVYIASKDEDSRALLREKVSPKVDIN